MKCEETDKGRKRSRGTMEKLTKTKPSCKCLLNIITRTVRHQQEGAVRNTTNSSCTRDKKQREKTIGGKEGGRWRSGTGACKGKGPGR